MSEKISLDSSDLYYEILQKKWFRGIGINVIIDSLCRG